MLNPITELAAGQFLLFYAILIGGTVLLCRWWSRLSDSTDSMPVPAVPSVPDPYEIAYLRGAEDEVMTVVIAGLYHRGYLCLDTNSEKTFQQEPNHLGVEQLSSLERSVFEWFAEARSSGDIQGELRWKVLSHCLPYEEKSQREHLLVSVAVESGAKLTRIAGAAVIGGVGASRAWVGFMRDTPIDFLLLMGVVGCIGFWAACSTPRLSSRGRRYLEEFSTSFAWLKGHTSSGVTTAQSARAVLQTPVIDRSNFLLLLGVFGLAAAEYSHLENVLKPPEPSGSAGGCGDGGCGGCGGCG